MRVFFASKHIKSIRMRVVLAQSIATAQEHDESEKTVDTEQKKNNEFVCGVVDADEKWDGDRETRKNRYFSRSFSLFISYT